MFFTLTFVSYAVPRSRFRGPLWWACCSYCSSSGLPGGKVLRTSVIVINQRCSLSASKAAVYSQAPMRFIVNYQMFMLMFGIFWVPELSTKNYYESWTSSRVLIVIWDILLYPSWSCCVAKKTYFCSDWVISGLMVVHGFVRGECCCSALKTRYIFLLIMYCCCFTDGLRQPSSGVTADVLWRQISVFGRRTSSKAKRNYNCKRWGMELGAFLGLSLVLFVFHSKSEWWFLCVRRKYSSLFFIQNKRFNLRVSVRIATNPFLLSLSDR